MAQKAVPPGLGSPQEVEQVVQLGDLLPLEEAGVAGDVVGDSGRLQSLQVRPGVGADAAQQDAHVAVVRDLARLVQATQQVHHRRCLLTCRALVDQQDVVAGAARTEQIF